MQNYYIRLANLNFNKTSRLYSQQVNTLRTKMSFRSVFILLYRVYFKIAA